MPTAEETIEELYFGSRTYTAKKQLYFDARKKNKDVTMEDVTRWIDKHVLRTKGYKHQNSWIPKGPGEEFQMDMFMYKYKQPDKVLVREYKFQKGKKKSPVEPYGLIAVDTWSKYCHVVPTHFKDKWAIKPAMEEIFKKMGKPKIIYSDPDSGFLSQPLRNYFKKENIEHIISRLHARVAERTIRTIKGLLKVEVDKDQGSTDPVWTDVLEGVLLTYNNENKHSAIGMTPLEARDPTNAFEARTNLELQRRKFRRYPPVSVGDKVRVYRKRGTFAKEDTGVWDKELTTVLRIDKSPITGQLLYHVAKATIKDKPFVRSELWLPSQGKPVPDAPAPAPEEKAEQDSGARGSADPPPAPKAKAKAKGKAEALTKEQQEMKVFEKLEARAKARAAKQPMADASKDLKILMGAMKFAK